MRSTAPPGVDLVVTFYGRNFSANTYRISVMVLTFLCYVAYHAVRKPPSIVKSVLAPAPGAGGGWAPFNGPEGSSLLGNCDVAFLSAYALGMFTIGHLGDRVDLRYYLTAGMMGTGVFVGLFGMGYFWDVHDVWYYYRVQIAAGLFSATGWPSVVAVMGNWCGKSKRGLIMGVWNAHTSVGNILGSFVAAAALSHGWGWSFVIPAGIMIACGLLMFGFLVVQPEDVGYPAPGREDAPESTAALPSPGASPSPAASHHGVGFLTALMIPGVVSFSACLFFSKLVAYTFLYWLPYYIANSRIGGQTVTPEEAGQLSTLFDVGGVVGGVLAGHLSDRHGAHASVSFAFLMLSIPCLYLYNSYGHVSMLANMALLVAGGILVNGPYALITTAVSADLGQHKSLKGNAKALATVSAIIDGTGSIGAAVGPLLTGYIAGGGGADDTSGWGNVFLMLYASALLAALTVLRLVLKECRMPHDLPTTARAGAATGDDEARLGLLPTERLGGLRGVAED